MVLGVLVVRTQPPASVPSPAADAFFIAANRLAVAGKFMEAIQAYRQALSVKPDLADAHFAIAMAQSRWGRHAEAVVSLETFLKLRPNSADAWFVLGNEVRSAGGDNQKAANAFRQALRLNPRLKAAEASLNHLRD
ncbi:MAG: tetratricopeptide repeat protein [Acidobacteriia bacterium]|nr:tetratricopeptide repeat protein [Terriglobia bacterium]